MPGVDLNSLRVRSALILVAVSALPLIGAVAIVADQGERSATSQALAQQQTLALALAADTEDYIRMRRGTASALASTPGLLDLTPDASHSLLRALSASYPDVSAFSVYTAAGEPLSRSDDLQLTAATGQPIFESARRSNAPELGILSSIVSQRPVFVLAAPIRDGDGRFAGLVVETLGSTTVAEHIAQVGGDKDMLAFLVDGKGRVIAHPNSVLVARFADLSASPSVAAFLQTDASSGTVTYSPSDGSGVQLAGYALVTDLGWGAIVERPACSRTSSSAYSACAVAK